MDLARVAVVFEVSLPVFGMIGLGKLLSAYGWMTADHRAFANRLIYSCSLPALLFTAIARQDPTQFLDPAMAVGAIGPTLVITAVFVGLARGLGYTGAFAAAFVFGSFWANTAYMGFPLAQNAFGGGVELPAAAAIFNTIGMPVYLILGYLIIGGYYKESGVGSFWQGVLKAVLNPIVCSALGGMVFSLILHTFRDGSGTLMLPRAALYCGDLVHAFLRLVGQLGLPLALLAIGGSLQMTSFRGRLLPLGLVLAAKLVGVPALAWLALDLFFPGVDHVVKGCTILISAMPNSVSSYVIATAIGVDEGFVSAMLVLSTLLSVVTIPLWLYLIL